MVASFPPEIVLHVFAFLPFYERTQTLLECALVCRAWRPLAQSALLTQVRLGDGRKEADEQVIGLLQAAKDAPGGWRCESLETGGVTLASACELFRAAKAIKSLELSLRSTRWGNPGREDDESEDVDVFDFECMQTAPNLEHLDLFLDWDVEMVLIEADSTLLTKLHTLVLKYKDEEWSGELLQQGVVDFVAGCSALKNVDFGPFPPEDHADLFEAIDSPLDKIWMGFILQNTGHESDVGEILRDIAQLQATSEVKEWEVFVMVYPNFDDEEAEQDAQRSAWETDEWHEWVAICRRRGIELTVTDNLDEYNAYRT